MLYANLARGMALIVIVVFSMTGRRVANPICFALPLTLLGFIFPTIAFGVALYQMSIAGLILTLGILVGNPIIVVHDLQRHLNGGVAALQTVSD